MKKEKYFNILTNAGGGFFGYGQILVLEHIEKITGKQIYQLFDAAGGTSVGSINTGPLSVGLKASQVKTFYTSWGPLIFKPNLLDIPARTTFAPKYDNVELKTALKTLLQIENPDHTFRQATLKDCKIKWLATSLNISKGLPTIFCSWLPSQKVKLGNSTFGEIIGYDSKMEMWEMILCSAAAPTFFPGVKANESVMIDGGLTGLNSPDSIMINMLEEFVGAKTMRMLSLGSGDSKWEISVKKMVKPCDLRAAAVILKTFLAAGVDSSNFSSYFKLKNNYYHLCPEYNPTFGIDDVETGLFRIPDAIAKLLFSNKELLNKFFDLK